jgi:hypothetical protein
MPRTRKSHPPRCAFFQRRVLGIVEDWPREAVTCRFDGPFDFVLPLIGCVRLLHCCLYQASCDMFWLVEVEVEEQFL